jgi:cbb3-type cytochrome oxidase maturation protein
MGVILLLILASLGVALVFLAAFIWAARTGQFEDTCTPSLRVLADETSKRGVPGANPLPESNSKEP